MKILEEWARNSSVVDVAAPVAFVCIFAIVGVTVVVGNTISEWEATRRAQITAKACGYTVVRGSNCRQVKCSEPGCNETTVAYICATGGE